jgi:hypothetical protein
MDIKTEMKEYHARNAYSEKALSGMIGLNQSIFNRVKNSSFHDKPDSNEARMGAWLMNFGYPLEEICSKLKELSTDRYAGSLPDGLVIARMRLHSQRAKLLRGIEINKTGMHLPTKKAASLQS